MRVAIVEASHWHIPLYLTALDAPGIDVVAVSDRENAKGREISARFDAKLYESYKQLLDREQIDFAFAFGRHSEMAQIGEELVRRKIPFTLEKPCGVCADEVARLRRKAEAAGVYVAVPFIFRISDFLAAVTEIEGRMPADFNHLQFRFNVGPPSRYVAAGAAWMLDPAVAGGGSTINVATHFIDLFRSLTGKEVTSVSAQMHARTHNGAVEDYSLVTLSTKDGVIGLVESGYGFPSTPDEQREFSFTLGSVRHYLRSGTDQIEYRERNDPASGTRSRSVRLNTDVYYPIFVEKVLAEYKGGKPSIAGLRDAEAMMRIMDAAYASARQGGTPKKVYQLSSAARDTTLPPIG